MFHTTGLSNSDLKDISLTAHSTYWDVSCNFVDDTTAVRCVVTKKLSIFHGQQFNGGLAGFFFSGTIPSARKFRNPTVGTTLFSVSFSDACSDGQTLWYTFEYSNESYQAEVWSDTPIDPDTFYSLYGVYPEYSSISTDNGQTSYIYGYTTTTSGYGSTPADNWSTLTAAYEAQGYTIQQTGSECHSGS